LILNPDITQGQTFEILGNTATEITVDISGGTRLTDVAVVGDTYVGVYEFDNVIFRRGGFLVLGDQVNVLDTVRIDEYGVLTHYDATITFESRLELTADTVEVMPTGRIDVVGRGYLGGNFGGNDASGQTLGNLNGSTYRSGGSYGGLGGQVEGAANPVYGDAANPAGLGSGGSGGSSSTAGGDGGGWILLEANNLQVDGVIAADGMDARGGNQAGSGSGGTVHITVGDLSGTGSITANGGAREVGGGGGRIAVYYSILSLNPASITAGGGIGSVVSGAAGTVHLEQQ